MAHPAAAAVWYETAHVEGMQPVLLQITFTLYFIINSHREAYVVNTLLVAHIV